MRPQGELPFLVVKWIRGFQKTQYRGLAKNTGQEFAMFALSDLLPGPLAVDATWAEGVPHYRGSGLEEPNQAAKPQ